MISRRRYSAFLDANVLYSAATRDICMEVALAKMYRPRWSEDVQREWIEAALRNRPDLQRDKLERTRDLMYEAIPSAMVTGYEHLIRSIPLETDPDDRHVVAAAIVGQCDLIVTNNIADFPSDTLSEFGLEAQRPDDFLAHHLDLEPLIFCSALRKARIAKKYPPYTVEEYLANLKRTGLKKTAAALRQYAQDLD